MRLETTTPFRLIARNTTNTATDNTLATMTGAPSALAAYRPKVNEYTPITTTYPKTSSHNNSPAIWG